MTEEASRRAFVRTACTGLIAASLPAPAAGESQQTKEKKMASMMYLVSNGATDPTKASLPLVMANGAVDAGHTASLVFVGDGVDLIKDALAAEVKGVAVPPFPDLMKTVVSKKVKVYV